MAYDNGDGCAGVWESDSMDLSDEEDFCDCGDDGAGGADEDMDPCGHDGDDIGDSTSAQ